MHELALAIQLVRIAEEEATAHGLRRVDRLRVELGALTCVSAEALRTSFDAAKRNTVARSATLAIGRRAAVGRCHDCARHFPVDALGQGCPICGEDGIDVLEGRELRVVEIEGA